MADFPALRGIFGVPVPNIDAAAIERAIADRVAENDQLDWKRQPYAKGEGSELAKDIAALANHRGGIIVLGVREENSAASASKPVTVLGPDVERQVKQATASHLRPFLGGVTVRQTDPANDGGGHYVVIEVPPSRDAPHAVSPNGPNEKTLEYPVRHGAETRYLRELEVATKYRDRVSSRADLIRELKTAHANGLVTVRRRSGYDVDAASISIAAVPVNAGSRPTGAGARTAETTFISDWRLQTRLPGHLVSFAEGYSHQLVRPAPQRTVFSTPDIVAELGHRGGGFLCHSLTALPEVSEVDRMPDRSSNEWALVPAERIEWALFIGIKFLVDHAIDTGASGEIELCAQLHFTHAGTRNGGIRTRVATRIGNANSYELPSPDSMSPKTTDFYTTAPIAVDPAPLGAAAFVLAADIFAEFGVDEPHVFTDSGEAVPDNMGYGDLPQAKQWLQDRAPTA